MVYRWSKKSSTRWKNSVSGIVVSIKKHEPKNNFGYPYIIVAKGKSNYSLRIGESFKTLYEAEKIAVNWMKNHPRGTKKLLEVS